MPKPAYTRMLTVRNSSTVSCQREDSVDNKGELLISEMNHTVVDFLFDSSDYDLRKARVTRNTVSEWSTAVGNGVIPEGFDSKDEFESHILALMK